MTTTPCLLAQVDSSISLLDWLVIAAYLLFTTLVGARLAGKQANIRDFFLAGRKLPWWAITGSIIATEISAVTFIAVPTISFARGGNLTYLQLAIGSILARIIIGLYFIPAYYQREIYSPYDYMGKQLGHRVKKITTLLFFVGAILGQGARIYVTAFVISVVTGFNLTVSIWIMGAFSICWTLLGGMTTVIWTDVIQFCVLFVGALLVLCYSVSAAPGSTGEIVSTASQAGKFQVLDFSTDPTLAYTFWCGLLAIPFLNLAALGTDQVMTQRMFCCRNQRDAAKAIITSSLGIGIALLMLLVGIALYAYFTPEARAVFEGENIRDRLLPTFITDALPVGVRGIIIAAVFASAVSSLDSALAALSQTTISAFIRPRPSTGRRRQGFLRKLVTSEIGLSKLLVVFWGVALCLMATACIIIARQYANAVDLAFALVAYTYGPLLGIFLLAFFRVNRDDSGLVWAIPLTLLTVFGLSVHNPWADWIVVIAAATILLHGAIRHHRDPVRVAALVTAALLAVCLHQYEVPPETAAGEPKYLAYPWHYVIGTGMTFLLGYCLGRPKANSASSRGTQRNDARKKPRQSRPRERRGRGAHKKDTR
ncbi:MAG: sodium/solute symporter [Planctomycetota bacterium]